ncbi:MAG TPA: CBS domain-containing protein [Methylovirgula sp.]|nr:CBS domain-containing protein [Methylovirgula sp.]
MQVQEVMTKDPVCCSPDTSLETAAALMADQNCGAIPVVDGDHQLVGIVTDRDIACRGVAKGLDPSANVRSVMSNPIVTVTPEMDLDECCGMLADNQIRRAPVVDIDGACCGMIAQADIAQYVPESEVGELVREVSQPSDLPSRILS